MTAIDQHAEIARRFPKLEYLVDDAADRPRYDQRVDDPVERHVLIGHGLVGFEGSDSPRADQFAHDGFEVVRVGTLQAFPITLRRCLIVGDENALADPPIGNVGYGPHVLTALGVHRPMCGDDLGLNKTR